MTAMEQYGWRTAGDRTAAELRSERARVLVELAPCTVGWDCPEHADQWAQLQGVHDALLSGGTS